MNRNLTPKVRKPAYPWVIRRYKHKIVIEITRMRIRVRRKSQSTIAPDCKPEIW
jgi:hypothetical protein